MARSFMSHPVSHMSRSPFSRSARTSAAVPGAPQAVTSTRSGRIARVNLPRAGRTAGAGAALVGPDGVVVHHDSENRRLAKLG
jgi:hypothetical protein